MLNRFWKITLPCGLVANILSLWVLARLRSVGLGRRGHLAIDFKLYAAYWRLAPGHGWSRMPLIAAIVIFALGCIALLIPS